MLLQQFAHFRVAGLFNCHGYRLVNNQLAGQILRLLGAYGDQNFVTTGLNASSRQYFGSDLFKQHRVIFTVQCRPLIYFTGGIGGGQCAFESVGVIGCFGLYGQHLIKRLNPALRYLVVDINTASLAADNKPFIYNTTVLRDTSSCLASNRDDGNLLPSAKEPTKIPSTNDRRIWCCNDSSKLWSMCIKRLIIQGSPLG
jgi:hypothetical protein